MTTPQPPPVVLKQAIVKQILSGDTIVLRNMTSKVIPPKERTLSLSGIVAPKLARRPNTNGEGGSNDEPYAWDAREFLRKKLIGKKVFFTVDATSQNTSREYGTIYIDNDSVRENVTEMLVAEGLVDVRRSGIKSNEAHQRLCELEDNAKASKKGKHQPYASDRVRSMKWFVEENHRNFVDFWGQKRIKSVVEHVRDGSTLKVLLVPDPTSEAIVSICDHYSITLMLSGIRCPTFRDDVPEPFAEEAKYFTECRLLQRDVEIILESVSNQNFLGTVIHPKGNITALLLSEGLARCVDWSMQCVTWGVDKLRAAEKFAKEKRLRLWKDYTPSGPIIDEKEREFQGKVVEVINAEALNVKLADGSTKKIFLASIRPPKLPDNSPDAAKVLTRPLYENPLMFEAREFLRKKLIGKKVNITVDYKQKPQNNFGEKVCCTVTIGGMNVAEALVSKGLAAVMRHRADDDQRSAHYDELLSAETKAVKACKGRHSKKEVPLHRVVDLTGDLQKSKQFFPFLQRAGRMDAIVEFVVSGSRLRVFVPRENCLITFILGGITCVRVTREVKSKTHPGDPYGEQALAFTKDLIMQRDVQIEVESMDKAGNFIGWLWIEGANMSEALVKEGFAEVHSTAARTQHFRQLQTAQEEAQDKKLRIWKRAAPSAESEKTETDDSSERSVNYSKVMVTEVRKTDLNFYAQHVDEGPKLEEVMQNLREEFTSSPPLTASYTPKKGDYCAALFQKDGLWYRARVDRIQGSAISITYIDFGNQEIITAANLASLPPEYHSLPPCAREYNLAFVKCPQDPEASSDARTEFFENVDNKVLLLNVEYKSGSLPYVTLLTSDEKDDIGKELVAKGFVFVDHKKDKKFQKIVNDYLSAQEAAKKNRLNLWQYGDVTEDDAKEFG